MSRKRTTKLPKQRYTAPSHIYPWFRLKSLWSISTLAVAIFVTYIPLFSNSFVDYDDPDYITRNPYIRSGLNSDSWTWAWTTFRSGNWHPLTWISHALDVSLFGLSPAGHHFTSLVIHILNSALLFLLLSAIARDWSRCMTAAALFALHPLAVESVSWAAERKNVLCTLFFFLTIAAYGYYVRRPSIRRFLGVVIAFALSLCAKPMGITLPFVLLLLDYWPLCRIDKLPHNAAFPFPQRALTWLFVEKLPLVFLSVASAIITLMAQSSAGAIASISVLPLAVRIANAICSYAIYVFRAFWPVGLVPFYPQASSSVFRTGASFLFLVIVSVATWRLRRRFPYLLVGWLFYLGTLVPVIGIVQVGMQAMADRYTYIPMIGIFVAVVWLAADLAARYRLRTTVQALVAAVILVMLASSTWLQVCLWHDDVTLWTYNLQVTPNNVVAEDNLGIALLNEGRAQEALPHFYRAISILPSDPIAATNVATDLLAHGRIQEAISEYQLALPKAKFIPMLLPNIHSNLGSAFLKAGNVEEAREHYKLALSLNPGDAVALAGLRTLNQ